MKALCSITLHVKLKEKLEKLSEKENKSQSDIVAEALEVYFAKQEKNNKK